MSWRALMFLGTLVTALAAVSGEAILLSNSRLRVGLEPARGDWRELRASASAANLVKASPESAGLWKLRFTSPAGPVELSPARASAFRVAEEGRQSLRLTWTGFGVPEAPSLSVTARVSLPAGESVSQWHLAADHLGSWQLREAHFPRLEGIARFKGERLAVPVWMGQLATRPRELLRGAKGKGRRLEFDYPGHTSLQCVAWYQEGGPGYYLSSDDTNAFRKSFVWEGNAAGQVSCWVEHLAENAAAPRAAYELPYQVRVGVFRGDWFTAAEAYRQWATNQYWARGSRLRQNALAPWVADTALWVWNRGRSAQVLEPAVRLRQALGLPVSVFWHWWHGCAYDTGFPEYFPPREGEAAFRTALAAAHAEGVHALVYMNQRLWGMTTRSWASEGAAKYAVQGADGKVRPEVYNTFTRAPCASMCLHTEFWRAKYAGLAETALRQLGVDGIYMDQACSSLACYAREHGHPLGGGTYWMEGFRKLATEIRRRSAGRAVTLAGEGVGESWLPYLDLMLSLQVSRERYAAPDGWDPIPFFQAVYHPFVVQYGNYSSLTKPPYDDLWPAGFAPREPLELLDRKFARQFLLEQARAFVWGQQPTLANFLPSQLAERPAEIAYVCRLARLRRQALEYLRDGTWLRPPVVRVPADTLEMSRLSIYAGQKGGLKTFPKRLPLALAGAWRAPDGRLGISLASIADTALEVTLELDPATHPVPKPCRVWRLDEAGRNPLSRLEAGRGSWRVALPPRGACVIEFAP